MNELEQKHLEKLGFRFTRNGVHSARTIMLNELELLFAYVEDVEAPKQTYIDAIVSDNCLGKQSGKTRALTARHLSELYSLDPNIPVFKLLRFFWNRDLQGHALLSALCAYARDPLFRVTVPYILDYTKGVSLKREILEAFLDDKEPGRYSTASLKSIAQNINSSWTKTGHLTGRNIKVRTEAEPTSANVAYSLILSIILGNRGLFLFDSEPVKMLDCSPGRSMELAQQAAEKGWLVFKKIGEIVEVQIPDHFSIPEIGGSQ